MESTPPDFASSVGWAATAWANGWLFVMLVSICVLLVGNLAFNGSGAERLNARSVERFRAQKSSVHILAPLLTNYDGAITAE